MSLLKALAMVGSIASVLAAQDLPAHSEIRVGLTTYSVSRISVLEGSPNAQASSSLTGAEILLRTQNIGIYGRSISGQFPSLSHGLGGAYRVNDIRLMLGTPAFTVEGGMMIRTLSSLDSAGTERIWRVGAKTQWEIGASHVQITLGAGTRFTKNNDPDAKTAFPKILGADLETTMLVPAPNRIPAYLLAGWRYESFNDPWTPKKRNEEMSGAFLGIGLRLGPGPVLK